MDGEETAYVHKESICALTLADTLIRNMPEEDKVDSTRIQNTRSQKFYYYLGWSYNDNTEMQEVDMICRITKALSYKWASLTSLKGRVKANVEEKYWQKHMISLHGIVLGPQRLSSPKVC